MSKNYYPSNLFCNSPNSPLVVYSREVLAVTNSIRVNTEQCAKEDMGLQEGGLWDPTSINWSGERNLSRFGCYKWYQSQTLSDVPTRALGPKWVDYEIPHPSVGEENETFLIRVWKPFTYWLLQMVSEPNTERCANEGTGS